jgi:hypothetical protein
MPDESGDAAYIRVGGVRSERRVSGAACVACSLVAIGAMAAVFGTPHTRSIRETHFRYSTAAGSIWIDTRWLAG